MKWYSNTSSSREWQKLYRAMLQYLLLLAFWTAGGITPPAFTRAQTRVGEKEARASNNVPHARRIFMLYYKHLAFTTSFHLLYKSNLSLRAKLILSIQYIYFLTNLCFIWQIKLKLDYVINNHNSCVCRTNKHNSWSIYI